MLHSSLHSIAGGIEEQVLIVRSSGYGQETIHELRTRFKKLRALLRWQKTGVKYLKDCKAFYMVAGQIRNIQVVQQVLNSENDLLRSFQNWLTIGAGKIKKQWNRKLFKINARQLIAGVGHLKFKSGPSKRFFSGRIKDIKMILVAEPVSDNQVHEVRKKLKDMYYVLSWWKKNVGSTSQLCKMITIEKLETLCHLIGEFNDKRIILIMLTTYASQLREEDLIREINPLIDKWEFIKRNEKDKLMSILRFELMNRE